MAFSIPTDGLIATPGSATILKVLTGTAALNFDLTALTAPATAYTELTL